MTDRIRIRRTASTAKTPRVTPQSSAGHFASNSFQIKNSQKNALPVLAFSSDSNKIISIKQNFHSFLDNLYQFLTNNSSTISYRGQVSQQSAELERLFNAFYQSVLKYSLQQNNKNNPSTRSSAISFLKKWQMFGQSIIDLKKTGPYIINQSIDTHFTTINSSLQAIMNNGTSKSNGHDQSYRNGRALQNQLSSLHSSVQNFLDYSKQTEESKRLSGELKNFSRVLNDAFNREFVQCGIAPNEVVRLRTKCYTACGDIIHGLKNANLFETSIILLFQSLMQFQNDLRGLLERLNLPTNYLVTVELEEQHETNSVEEDEEDEAIEIPKNEEVEPIAFDEDLPIIDFIKDSHEKYKPLIKNYKSNENFFGILLKKATELDTQVSQSSQNKEIVENEKQKANEEIERLHRENGLLLRERQVFMDESDSLREENIYLKQMIDQLKRELKENEENHENQIKILQGGYKLIINKEINDNQALISEALKLHTTVQEELASMKETEKQLKELLKSNDVITSTTTLIKKLTDANANILRETKSNEELTNQNFQIKNIFSNLSKLDSIVDVAYEILESFKKLQHFTKSSTLSEAVDSIYMMVTETKTSLSHISSLPQKQESNLLVLANDIVNSINMSRSILLEIIESKEENKQIVDISKEIMAIHQRYQNNFASILSVIQASNSTSQNIDNETVQKLNDAINRILKELNRIVKPTNNHSSQSYESIFIQLKSIEKKMNQEKENINELTKFLKEIETLLISSFGESGPSINQQRNTQMIMKSIRALLTKLTVPHPEIKQEIVKPSINDSAFIKNVETKLCKIAKDHPVDDISKQAHIFELLDKIDELMKNNDDFIRFVESKLGLKNANLSAIQMNLTKMMANNNFDLNKIFEKIFDLEPAIPRTEPSHYLPEICESFINMHNSIASLKSFAGILNEIFNQFDCKLQSFRASTQSFQFIKGQILQLHTALNRLTPNKVNSLVFLVLSRFVALVSSFVAAISAASFDDGDPNMKETFFKMQMELCEAKKVL